VKTVGDVARVVLESRLPQLDRLFDYAIPPSLEISAGMRVKVPLRSGNRTATGFVVAVVAESDHQGSLASITERLSDVCVMPEELWGLARAVADRQAGTAADVLRLAIPQRYVRQEKVWQSRDANAPFSVSEASEVPGFPETTLDSMTRSGARTVLTPSLGVTAGHTGTPRPRSTEVVAGLAHRVFARGQSVVIVVPDWRDIEHYRGALADHLPSAALVESHSDLPGATRYLNFLRGLEGSPVVVIGNRHAVYHPAPNVGLIVVVEDGDDAHREPLAPYPHSRDVALVRASQINAALVFVSSVPSLSSMRWVSMGFCEEVRPSVHNRPTVIPTALTLASDTDLSPARLPTQAHQAAKEALLSGPVLVQVFRTGFSTGLACASCGERGACSRCQGPLRLKTSRQAPECTWCGHAESPWRCAACGAAVLVPRGQGIGRTVSDLGKAFPKVPVIRSDGENRLLEVGPEPALVVATRGAEPLCPGGYRVALLLDGLAMLSRESLSTLEDTVRSWENAISMVAPDGRVFVTEVEGTPGLAVASGSYQSLLAQELGQRDLTRLPPALRMASITGPASVVADMRERMVALDPSVDALGPVSVGEGLTRSIIRFPYSMGVTVTAELRAMHLKYIARQGKNKTLRIRIVVDDPGQLDALVAE
jgi:primosomal protein N' (replication factor Y) (superfamily II helicase)